MWCSYEDRTGSRNFSFCFFSRQQQTVGQTDRQTIPRGGGSRGQASSLLSSTVFLPLRRTRVTMKLCRDFDYYFCCGVVPLQLHLVHEAKASLRWLETSSKGLIWFRRNERKKLVHKFCNAVKVWNNIISWCRKARNKHRSSRGGVLGGGGGTRITNTLYGKMGLWVHNAGKVHFKHTHTHTHTPSFRIKKSFSFSSPPKTSTVLKKLDLFSITPEGIWNRTLTKVGRDEQSYAMLLDDDDVDVGDVLQTSTYTEG